GTRADHLPEESDTGRIRGAAVVLGGMYRVDRNNFYTVQKKATIYTPKEVSEFLFDVLRSSIHQDDGVIFDPCVGNGSLLLPWKKRGYDVFGVDIEDQDFPNTKVLNYLEMTKKDVDKDVSLVVMNPPFNIDDKTKEYIKNQYGGRPLLPEVWLQKVIELLGKDIPIVMFTPYGFRLNQTEVSKRWQKFSSGEYPEITSIISLPKDVFDGVLFHSEILCFNLPKMKGHYFVQTNRSEGVLFR
ncbi:MAG: N-6 DNA methylase, partial [Candidatus Kaiserbacteria bacterium]|nr:N-6 DNA methylase [Candidatus Kaiserbacteria bacterium]